MSQHEEYPNAQPGARAEIHTELSPAQTTAAIRFAEENRLALDTIVEGALALLLAGYGDLDDVCFGVVLADMDAALPVRVRLDFAATVIDTLTKLAAGRTEARRHAHTVPEVGASMPFDTILDLSGDTGSRGRAKLAADPLTIHLQSGEQLGFVADFATAAFDESRAQQIVKHLGRLVNQIVSRPESRLLDLSLPQRPSTSVPTDRDSGSAPDAQVAAARDGRLSPTEATLVGVWCDLLGLPEVGVRDNFFELGGDSVMSIRVATTANAKGIPTTLRMVFDNPTIELLARAIDAARTPGPVPDDPRIVVPDDPGPLLEQSVLESLGVGRNGIVDAYPCSPLQLGMLFHSLNDRDAGAFFNQSVMLVRGELDLVAMEAAWHEVIARHDVLRSSFEWTSVDEPVQLVHESPRIPFVVVDDATPKVVEDYLARDREIGLDPACPPLMRVAALVESPTVTRIAWTWHHALLDGWSAATVVDEVASAYEAARSGIRSTVVERRSYREYIEWLDQQNMAAAEGYWKKALEGYETPASSATNSKPGEYRDLSWSFSAEATAALARSARENQLTLNTLVQGAWAVLLSGYNGVRDVCFGVTSSGRPAEIAGVDEMVGSFLSTTPLRVMLDPHQTVLDLLARLQTEQVSARSYEYASLSRIQSWSRAGSGQRLFDTVLVFNSQPREHHTLFENDEREGAYSSYPLTLTVYPADRLTLLFEYQSAHFRDDEIHLLKDHFVRLLESMTSAWQMEITALPAIPAGLTTRTVPGPAESGPPDHQAPDDSGRTAARDCDPGPTQLTPEEAILSEVWAQTLNRDHVDIHENFFALGGDSIMSIRVVALAAGRGVHFAPSDVFDQPTIAGLAKVVHRAMPSHTEPSPERVAMVNDDVMAKLATFFTERS